MYLQQKTQENPEKIAYVPKSPIARANYWAWISQPLKAQPNGIHVFLRPISIR